MEKWKLEFRVEGSGGDNKGVQVCVGFRVRVSWRFLMLTLDLGLDLRLHASQRPCKTLLC